MSVSIHSLAAPAKFMEWSGKILPFLWVATGALFALGLYFAFTSPPDYQQGETVRIMYVHVPAAWMALSAYVLLGAGSAAFLIWRHGLADVIARETAPLGACFTLICLVTGSIWGKPMWGAWWVWDARLTSVLALFFLYVGYMALDANTQGNERGRKACAWLALIGLANLPVIKFSVEWWNTLHQPASVIRAGGPVIAPEMLTPLMLMAAAFALFFMALLIVRVRAALTLQKQRRAQLQGR
jgi:heme exporter protein C